MKPNLTNQRPKNRQRRDVPEAAPAGAVFLTKPQIAAALQVSVRCVTAMMRRGDIPYVKLSGRFVRFQLEDVRRQMSEVSSRNPEVQKQ